MNDLSLSDLAGIAEGATGEHDVPCPLCGDGKRESLSVNMDSGLWICHRCNSAGKLIEFGNKSGSRRVRSWRHYQEKAPPSAENCDVVKVGVRAIYETPGETYLEGRGISAHTAADYGVRYFNDWFGRGAVLFQGRDRQGNRIAVQGRYIQAFAGASHRTAGICRRAVFAKPNCWEYDPLVLVESPIDALSLAECSFPAVALFGAGNRPAWLPSVCRGRHVLVGLDADEGGDKGAEELIEVLNKAGARAERLRPCGGNDWNSILQQDTVGLRCALRERYKRVRTTHPDPPKWECDSDREPDWYPAPEGWVFFLGVNKPGDVGKAFKHQNWRNKTMFYLEKRLQSTLWDFS